MSIAPGASAQNSAAGVSTLSVTLTNVKKGSAIYVVAGFHTARPATLTCSDGVNSYSNIFPTGTLRMQAFAANAVAASASLTITVTISSNDTNFMLIAQEIRGSGNVYFTGENGAFSTGGGSSANAGAVPPIISGPAPAEAMFVLGVWRASGSGPTGQTNMNSVVTASAGTENISTACSTSPGAQFTTESPFYISYGASVVEYVFLPLFLNVPPLGQPLGLSSTSIAPLGATFARAFTLANGAVGTGLVVSVLTVQLAGKAEPTVSVSDYGNTYSQVANILQATGPTYQVWLQVFAALNAFATSAVGAFDIVVRVSGGDTSDTDILCAAAIGSGATSYTAGTPSSGATSVPSQTVSAPLGSFAATYAVFGLDVFDGFFPYPQVPIASSGSYSQTEADADNGPFAVVLQGINTAGGSTPKASILTSGTPWAGFAVGFVIPASTATAYTPGYIVQQCVNFYPAPLVPIPPPPNPFTIPIGSKLENLPGVYYDRCLQVFINALGKVVPGP